MIATPLGDREHAIEFAVRGWEQKGLRPVVVPMRWFDRSRPFQSRLDTILDVIDGLLKKENTVSLVGLSAGGSIVLNAFVLRREGIDKVVTVCSRINPINNWGYRSFNNRTSSSPAYAESIMSFEEKRKLLQPNDYQKIMTVRPFFGDQLNPANTMVIPGARNITLPIAEHFSTIAMSLTVLSNPLISFIKS